MTSPVIPVPRQPSPLSFTTDESSMSSLYTPGPSRLPMIPGSVDPPTERTESPPSPTEHLSRSLDINREEVLPIDPQPDSLLLRSTFQSLDQSAATLKRLTKTVLASTRAYLALLEQVDKAEDDLLGNLGELGKWLENGYGIGSTAWDDGGVRKARRDARRQQREETEAIEHNLQAVKSELKRNGLAGTGAQARFENNAKQYYQQTFEYLAPALAPALSHGEMAQATRTAQFDFLRYSHHSTLLYAVPPTSITCIDLLVGLYNWARRDVSVSHSLARLGDVRSELLVAWGRRNATTSGLETAGRMEAPPVRQQRKHTLQAVGGKLRGLLTSNSGDRPAERPAARPAERPVARPAERPVARPAAVSRHSMHVTRAEYVSPFGGVGGLGAGGDEDEQREEAGRKKEGVLWGAGTWEGLTKSAKSKWERYWVVLDHSKIHEYRDGVYDKPEVIDLRFASVREGRGTDRRFVFELVTPRQGRRLYQATSEREMKQWLYAICNAIESCINGSVRTDRAANRRSMPVEKWSRKASLKRVFRQSADERSLFAMDVNRRVVSESSTTLARLEGRMTRSEDTLDSCTQELKRIADLPENRVCADCGRGMKSSRWATLCLLDVPMVMFLCIRCVGVHRSLGTHVSKPRSVDLDRWTPESVALARQWGNARGNALWERERPDFVVDDGHVAEYIKAKYVEGRWLSVEQRAAFGMRGV